MLNLGLRRSFPWIFTIAQIKTPILGADFLSHFNVSVNMATRSLVDCSTELTAKGITSIYKSIGICAAIPDANGLQELITNFQLSLRPLNILIKFVIQPNIISQPLDHPHMLHHADYIQRNIKQQKTNFSTCYN